MLRRGRSEPAAAWRRCSRCCYMACRVGVREAEARRGGQSGGLRRVPAHTCCPSAQLFHPPRRASEEEEWSDDEDVSWKVRRAAARLVEALVAAYPDAVAEVYAR